MSTIKSDPAMPSPGACLVFSGIITACIWFIFSGWAMHVISLVREFTAAPSGAQAIVGSLGLFVMISLICYAYSLDSALVNPFKSLPQPPASPGPGESPADAVPGQAETSPTDSFSSMSPDEFEAVLASATVLQRNQFSSIVSFHGKVKVRLRCLRMIVPATILAILMVSPGFANGWFLANVMVAALALAATSTVNICPSRFIDRYGNRPV